MREQSMMLKSVEKILNEILQPQLAQGWDNVGLLVGDRGDKVRRMLVCIDLTAAVLAEAKSHRAELILVYHPPIFEPLKRICAEGQEIIFQAIRSKIAIYAIHTALDVLSGGTSDVLADLVDMAERKPIEIVSSPGGKSKLVVFVPYEAKALEKVSLAIFQAGGGQIGEYSCCSFLTAGHGTFKGSMKTHPAVGKAGQFESVEEMRMEVVVDNEKLPEVVRAMKAVHPYEEPAYDIYPLVNEAGENPGIGRIGQLPKTMDLKTIAAMIKKRTGLKFLQVADCGKKKLQRIAVGPGSCGKMLEQLAGKIDLFITGEIRHHTALAACRDGISIICLGHGNSERLALKPLRKILMDKLPEVEVVISTRDSDPLSIL
ncbi:MAG: Nif3-like dinuclear metal center hexameric protein [Phycisphaerae bacterium]